MKKFMLTVPEPCHENWEAMTPEDKGRFCMACQKTVVDFTDKTDRELGLFFKKKTENVCGRFNTNQLDKVLAVPPQPLPFLKYAAAIALPAFLLSCEGHTQGKMQVIEASKVTHLTGDTTVSHVMVGKPMYQPSRIEEKPVKRKLKGRLRVQAIPIEKDLSCFSLPPNNYKPIENIINTKQKNVVNEDEKIVTMGMLVTAQPIKKITIRKESKKIIENNLVKSPFTIYPNPALGNSYIKLDVRQLKEGEYNLSIANSMGEVVDLQKVMIKKETPTVGITLKQLMAGPYFVYLTNSKTTKSYSEILIVQ